MAPRIPRYPLDYPSNLSSQESSAYALAFGAAAGILRDARVTRAILRVGGFILAAFGIGLAVERPAST